MESTQKKRLSSKEKGFVKDIVAGETGTQAALNNYDVKDEHSAGSLASQNLGKLRIQEAIEKALPNDILVEIHREGLYATKPFFDKEGNKLSEDADFAVRHKYLDTAYKLKGAYGAEDGSQTKSNTTYNFIFSKEVQAEVKEIEARIKAKLIGHVTET